jgi:hypothetical protein
MIAALVLAAAACGGGKKARPVVDGPDRSTRPAAVACSATRPPGDADPALGASGCKVDGDCTAGRNGRCTALRGRKQYNRCTYDLCTTDADCTGGPCDCRPAGNVCDTGNCKVDADCGDGDVCLGLVESACFGFRTVTYHCTASDDTCSPDGTDCPNGKRCEFAGEVGHYTCKEVRLCPMG